MTDEARPTGGSRGHTDKEPLIHEMMGLFEQIMRRMREEQDEENEWLIQNCRNPELIGILRDDGYDAACFKRDRRTGTGERDHGLQTCRHPAGQRFQNNAQAGRTEARAQAVSSR